MRGSPNGRNDAFIVVLSVTVVLGMAVALGLVFLWRTYPATVTQGGTYHLAVALCPPFILVGVVSAMAESTLAVVLTTGTIIFANGSLYAGVAALAYWAFSIRGKHGTS